MKALHKIEKMTNYINQNIEDQMLFISQLCPGASAQMAVPQQGESKRKRRRKKSKRGENESEGSKKRKLSEEQVKLLEMNFRNERKLESERKDRLASELDLVPRQVAVWFQNRRARWKNKKLEEEYSNLKLLHETVVLENCHLQSEVMKLKEELSQAGKEIKRLSEKLDAVSSRIPSSSLTVENMDPPFLGERGVECDDVFYMLETNYMTDMDWLISQFM